MTIYSVKINKHEVVKTTALHEAIAIAKRALVDKLVARGASVVSVSEKIYLDRGESKATYRIFATIYEKNGLGVYKQKTFSNAIKMEHISNGGYDFELHAQISNAIEVKKNENH